MANNERQESTLQKTATSIQFGSEKKKWTKGLAIKTEKVQKIIIILAERRKVTFIVLREIQIILLFWGSKMYAGGHFIVKFSDYFIIIPNSYDIYMFDVRKQSML